MLRAAQQNFAWVAAVHLPRHARTIPCAAAIRLALAVRAYNELDRGKSRERIGRIRSARFATKHRVHLDRLCGTRRQPSASACTPSNAEPDRERSTKALSRLRDPTTLPGTSSAQHDRCHPEMGGSRE